MNKNLIRGSLETIILNTIDKYGEMYGYEICKVVSENTNHSIVLTEGALYPQLHKLEGKNLLQVRHEKTGNRIRKYYSLTETGVAQKNQTIADLEHFISMMSQLISVKNVI